MAGVSQEESLFFYFFIFYVVLNASEAEIRAVNTLFSRYRAPL